MIGSSFQDQPGVLKRLGHASLLFARDRLMELIGLALILAGVAMTLALSTFNPLDPSFNNATPEQPWNLLGRPGSYFADIVMQTVGLGAIAFVPPIAVSGWWFMAKQGPGHYATRFLCWIVAGLCASSLAASLPIQAPAPLETSLGGVIGDLIYDNLIGVATSLGVTDPRSLRLFAGIIAAVFALVTFAVAVGVRITDYRVRMRPNRRGDRAATATTETAAAADPAGLSWWQRWAAMLAGLFGAVSWSRRDHEEDTPRPALEHAGTHYPDRDPVFDDRFVADAAVLGDAYQDVTDRGGWGRRRRAAGEAPSTPGEDTSPEFDLVATPWAGDPQAEDSTDQPIEAEEIDPYQDSYDPRDPTVARAASNDDYDYAPVDVAPESYEPAFDRADRSAWSADDEDAELNVMGLPDDAPEQPAFSGRQSPFAARLDRSEDDGNWDESDPWGNGPHEGGSATVTTPSEPPSPAPHAFNAATARSGEDQPTMTSALGRAGDKADNTASSGSEPPWAEGPEWDEDEDDAASPDAQASSVPDATGDPTESGVKMAAPFVDPPMPPRTFAAIRTLKASERSIGAPARQDMTATPNAGADVEAPLADREQPREAARETVAPTRAAAPTQTASAAPTAPVAKTVAAVERSTFTARPKTRFERSEPPGYGGGRTVDVLELDAASYSLPPLELLQEARNQNTSDPEFDLYLEDNARQLETVLQDFGVRGEIINIHPGPVVTLYELEPAPGIKSSRVIGLADDIARSMSAVSARVAVIPGRNAIGIELPNKKRELVYLRELLASPSYEKTSSRLALALGKQISGDAVIVDLANMPHLLIAGTTGSGKSVAINTMILSLLYRMPPSQCKLILIDPKMLELSVYEGIPHLLTPVVTDPKKAIVALKWVVREMEDRYKKMSKLGVRNIKGYNERIAEAAARDEVLTRSVQTGFDKETGEPIYEEEVLPLEAMPFIVVVVDEMADLMMVAGKDIETAVQRLAQMARAAGIHLITATQRPSVDVITGTIKANFPTRISFQVTSKIDSRTILGEQGAEQLLGQGDMLYMAGGGRIRRVHGPFVSDAEVEDVVAYLKDQGQPAYVDAILEETEDGETESFFDLISGNTSEDSGDDLFDRAVAIVAKDRKASTSYIQRKLQIGYNRAARLIERMEEEGMISPANHVGKREVLLPDHEGEDD